MIKVSDFIAKFIAENDNVGNELFLVSGGGNMHIIDSIGRNDKLNYICNHHEQACAIAAEGYSRSSGKVGVAVVTTGPGGTNAITGVMGAWVDSIPTLTISGQVKFETSILSQPELNLRQLGDQEINIVDIVKPITKYAVTVTDKNEIKYHLSKAVYLSLEGRPGPVWIDIPLDVQGAMVNEDELKEFIIPDEIKYDNKLEDVIQLLLKAERPVIIAGNGIVLSDGVEDFLKLVNKLSIPVVGTFARYDIIKEDDDYYFGRYGTVGHRAGNFIVQNSDLIIALGARLNVRAISYNWEFFGREAKKILVDIDESELNKHTLNIDLKVKSDAKYFINELSVRLDKVSVNNFEAWIDRCKKFKQDFPTIEPFRQKVEDYVDSYNFFDIISNLASKDSIYVFGNGTACVSSYQSLRLYDKQKVVVNSGCASMGYDIPAAIGASVANNDSEIICVTGDGSIQMNIQELQTIVHYKLPIKLFVFNNNGYISIRNTQNNFFNGFKVGSDSESGVSFPNIIDLANAYGIKNFRIETQQNLKNDLKEVLDYRGSVICEIILDPQEKMEPKLSSEVKPDGKIISKPLEDMYPFLGRNEFDKNMIIKKLED